MNRVENDDLSLLEKLFHGPLTRTGWWAVGLALGFLALFAVMCTWPSRLAAEGQHNRTFWAYPPYSPVVISTGICGSAAGLASEFCGLNRLCVRSHSRASLQRPWGVSAASAPRTEPTPGLRRTPAAPPTE